MWERTLENEKKKKRRFSKEERDSVKLLADQKEKKKDKGEN